MLCQTRSLLLLGRHISCSNNGLKRRFISRECNMLSKYGIFRDKIHWRSVTTSNILREEDKNECHHVTFIKRNGERIEAKGKEGDTLLDVVVNNNLDFDGFGACEGTLTCSTCHVILKKEDYDKLPDKPGDEEMDMLDLAYELTDTSRLGCQIALCKELDGLEVQLPSSINDARS